MALGLLLRNKVGSYLSDIVGRYMVDCFTGIGGVYKGLTATIMKQGSNQAIRFFVMESLKDLYKGDDKSKPVPKLLVGAFGVIAGNTLFLLEFT